MLKAPGSVFKRHRDFLPNTEVFPVILLPSDEQQMSAPMGGSSRNPGCLLETFPMAPSCFCHQERTCCLPVFYFSRSETTSHKGTDHQVWQWALPIVFLRPVVPFWLLRARAFSVMDNLTTHLSDFRTMITFYKLFVIPQDSKFPAESFMISTSVLNRGCREFPYTPSLAGTIAPNGNIVIINNPIS